LIDVVIQYQELGWTKVTPSFNAKCTVWLNTNLICSEKEILIDHLISLLKSSQNSFSEIESYLKSLRGNFSFIVHDDSTLIAAVDRVCSIPLFYGTDGAKLIIGSNATNVKKILGLSEESLDISAALEIGMSGFTIGKKTLFKRMSQMVAGEYIHKTHSNLTNGYYYTYSPWRVSDRSYNSLKNDLAEETLNIFEEIRRGIDGRQLIIPLSAGADSRLVVSALKHVGAKNVLCISYGINNNYEMAIGREVAEKLGYRWKPIVLTRKDQAKYYDSLEFEAFCSRYQSYSSVPHIQELNVFRLLSADGMVSPDAVILNGSTGDFISGGHIPISICNTVQSNASGDGKLFWSATEDFLNKHYTLWRGLRCDVNDRSIITALSELERERRLPTIENPEILHGLFECYEYLGRQSKYIIRMQQAYQYYGFSWRLPLWDARIMDFWESVPLEFKINQRLYKEVIHENNWGGVWHSIPVNMKTIRQPLATIRAISKLPFTMMKRRVWEQFERNFFSYFLDVTASYAYAQYSRIASDRRGHRNIVSFLAEDYLSKFGLKLSELPTDEFQIASNNG